MSCEAKNCQNTSRKGVKMCTFPKDPDQRAKWLTNVGRTNWLPKKYSALCEYHFVHDAFETIRVDGTKRLKRNAVPTIFGQLVTQIPSKWQRKTGDTECCSEETNFEETNAATQYIRKESLTPACEGQQIGSINQVGKETDTYKQQTISVLKPVNITETCTKENPNFQETSTLAMTVVTICTEETPHLQERNTSTMTADVNTCVEDNSDLETEANNESLERTSFNDKSVNDNTKVTKRVPNCKTCKPLVEHLYKQSEISKIAMKRTFKRKEMALRRRIKALEDKVRINEQLTNGLLKTFSDNQIKYVCGQWKRMPKWCDNALIQGYKLKFACGYSGYRELLNQGFPLPSLRTLNEKLDGCKFTSGISNESFQFLQLKISCFKSDRDKDCLIVLDEISITSGIQYDSSLADFIGYVTLPGHNDKELATHGLVFMLAGISHRWKQTVAFYFTGNSTDGSKFKTIILDIIKQAEDIGLNVYGVVSDMGAPNQAMWRTFNIHVSRHSTIHNKCKHPLHNDRYLYFFHDVSHGIKNFKEGLMNHKTIVIPDSFVNKYSLPSNKANAQHVYELLEEQKGSEFLLATKLKEEYIDRSKHFQKMRVPSASNVLSHEVSTALQFLSEEYSKPEYKTTAWLIDYMARWFKTVSSRHVSIAISKKNDDKFNETIEFLTEFIEFMRNINFGDKVAWKPFQRGMIISTMSIIELSTFLIKERNYSFVLTSRFTQDCIENLFSVLRLKNSTLNALQFKTNLRLTAISHYMKKIPTSNYSYDVREFLPEFLNTIQEIRKQRPKSFTVEDENKSTHRNICPLTNVKLNILHNISGYIISSIKKSIKTCKQCISSLGSFKCKLRTYNVLTSLRCYKTDTLFFVNDRTFNFFIEMEKIFRSYIKDCRNTNKRQFFVAKCNNISFFVPPCHNLKDTIIKRFITFRLKINPRQIRAQKLKQYYGSKTMAMHNIK